MAPPPKPGRRPGQAGITSAARRRVVEVVGLVGKLGGVKRPVRFSEIYPELQPPVDSEKPVLWQKTMAWRALEQARREGSLVRTADGYRVKNSLLFPIQGLRASLDEWLELLNDVAEGRRELVNMTGGELLAGLISDFGRWLRAVGDEARDRVSAPRRKTRSAVKGEVHGAAGLAAWFSWGFLQPELEAAGVIVPRHQRATRPPGVPGIFPQREAKDGSHVHLAELRPVTGPKEGARWILARGDIMARLAAEFADRALRGVEVPPSVRKWVAEMRSRGPSSPGAAAQVRRFRARKRRGGSRL